MWPYSTRSSRFGTTAPEPPDFPKFEEFAISDAKVKVWLPQILEMRLDWLSVKLDCSKPDVVRAIIFEHLYGRLAYHALLLHCKVARERVQDAEVARATRARGGLDSTMQSWVNGGVGNDETKFSASRSTPVDLQHLGRSDLDFTLTMPQRLLMDLKDVAAIHNITPSHYVRKLLVLHFLGERVHSKWQQALGKISPDVAELER